MAFLENKWGLVSLVILCWAIATSFLAGHYYFQFTDLSAKISRGTVSVNLGFKHGNGSNIAWFNETEVNAGSSLLDLTSLVVSVNYTEGLAGATIDSIDDVENLYPHYWTWWSWTTYGWAFGSVAADRYIAGDNETLLWFYQDISAEWPPPPP